MSKLKEIRIGNEIYGWMFWDILSQKVRTIGPPRHHIMRGNLDKPWVSTCIHIGGRLIEYIVIRDGKLVYHLNIGYEYSVISLPMANIDRKLRNIARWHKLKNFFRWQK